MLSYNLRATALVICACSSLGLNDAPTCLPGSGQICRPELLGALQADEASGNYVELIQSKAANMQTSSRSADRGSATANEDEATFGRDLTVDRESVTTDEDEAFFMIYTKASSKGKQVCVSGTETQYEGQNIVTQCCKASGSGACERYGGAGNNANGCHSGKSPSTMARTHQEALAYCQGLGDYGLCDKNCGGKGCNYDNEPAWTSIPCDPNADPWDLVELKGDIANPMPLEEAQEWDSRISAMNPNCPLAPNAPLLYPEIVDAHDADIASKLDGMLRETEITLPDGTDIQYWQTLQYANRNFRQYITRFKDGEGLYYVSESDKVTLWEATSTLRKILVTDCIKDYIYSFEGWPSTFTGGGVRASLTGTPFSGDIYYTRTEKDIMGSMLGMKPYSGGACGAANGKEINFNSNWGLPECCEEYNWLLGCFAHEISHNMGYHHISRVPGQIQLSVGLCFKKKAHWYITHDLATTPNFTIGWSPSNSKHIAVIGYPNHEAATRKEECLSDRATTYGEDLGTGWDAQDKGKTLGVACCDDAKGYRPDCRERLTYVEARKWCEHSGKRLCTREELTAGKSTGTGCSFDETLQWSSDVC